MKVAAGATDVSVYYYIQQDASGTSPGEPVTGLLFSDIETGGSASYVRPGAARTDLTLVTLASASAAHTDGGFVEVDATNMPGLYRCDYPDAAFADGAANVYCQIVVASANNAVASPVVVEIDKNETRLEKTLKTIIDYGTAQSVSSNTIQLRAAFSTDSDDDILGSIVFIESATTGAYQSAVISSWNNTTKTATVDAWVTALTGTVEYIVIASPSASSGLPMPANVTQVGGTAEDLPTQTSIDTSFTDIKGATFNTSTDSLEAIRDRGDSAWATGGGGASPDLLVNTTIATLSSQTVFTLTAGSSDDDAYKDMAVVITDAATSVQKSVCRIESYVGSTKEITLKSAPAFTIATTDIIDVIANTSITETDIVTGGAINTTAGAVDNVTLTDTTTTNTDMRGTDNAALASVVTESRLSELDAVTPGKMANQVDSIKTDTAAILVDTAEIGTAGAGLTDLGGMSTAMKAEVLAEVQKLLTTQMTESYAADGVAPTLTQALMLIQQVLTEFAITGTTNTIKQIDGTTTAATITFDSATSATSATRTT